MPKIFHGNGPWATLDTGIAGPRDASALLDAGFRDGWAILVEDGIIVESDTPDVLRARHPDSETTDLGDSLVTPGLVDPHTHPVFTGTREDEFEMRNQGHDYVAIAKAGGGIRNSARRLRASSEDELVADLRARCDGFLALGTTTIEAKSGYGLSTESELASLRAIRRVDADHPLDLVPTFLGAHEIPDEYREDREGYIALLIDEMLPRVAEENLAEACDVFCEEHVFTVDESRRILGRARALGMKVKLHADEIRPLGGAELAAELGALSADHLVAVSDEGLDRMRESGVVPILLPATSLYLNLASDAPGKKMLDRGLAPALATDFNPGSSPTRSLPLVMTFACLKYGMTAAQALGAATWNAACAIGREGKVGTLADGALADLVVWDLPNLRSLPYRFGESFVSRVLKRGEWCFERAGA
ncbi:MAG: imidazolonepropionase [Planctomycetes bacterium]|nr:imidazolonepropionase [Planctomycetota bacterium]